MSSQTPTTTVVQNKSIVATTALPLKRLQESILAKYERQVLFYLAARLPQFITPDKLSLLGLLAMLLAGVAYYASRNNSAYLHVVNLGLLLNWFGDSLDGTLARYRNRQRPRYGYYVDHMIDTMGMAALMIGLVASGYMSERVASILLVVYFMLAINSYLAAYSLGVFSISFAKFSPTELRILLAIGNLVLIYHPHATIAGHKYLLYDVGGVIASIGMGVILAVTTIQNIITLYRQEKYED
jgi:archaetidylinositol phosphate synthase